MPWPDLAGEMLRWPIRGLGRVFHYSDASTYVAMPTLGARLGDVLDWLRPRLFSPLGVQDPSWHRCPIGWIIAGSGLELRTEELARIGRVLRDRGDWKGQLLVSPAWVDGMHTGWISTGSETPFDRYGIAAWAGPGQLWRLDAANGQYVLIDQQHNAVITNTAHEPLQDYRLVELAAHALKPHP